MKVSEYKSFCLPAPDYKHTSLYKTGGVNKLITQHILYIMKCQLQSTLISLISSIQYSDLCS